ncbi:hypothetical protein D0T12_01960 [Actinomadura spongiicola]|uniref:Uncharacterized protein n=1 Tax=Actinomadura spongiicola TaxID=2303421 RepID=A0A372GNR5_9ACTN|nr:hypothetical protein [Actinomadura spongiicola]RFS87041.1 hypothetical protein D0T12_01960 [Actinomadura spongiicola]
MASRDRGPKVKDRHGKLRSAEVETYPTLSPGGEELFGRLPVWANVLGGIVLAALLCVPLFL